MDFMATITKRTILEGIINSLGGDVSPRFEREMKRCIDSYFEYLIDRISSGHVVYFTGVGKIYSLYKKAGRPVRNPKTGEPKVMSETINYKFSSANNNTKNTRMFRNGKVTKEMQLSYLESYINQECASLFLIKSESNRLARLIHSVIISNINSVVKDGHRMEVRGFGVIHQKVRRKCIVRNPKSGERFESEERKLISYKAGSEVVKRGMSLLDIAS